MMIPERLNEQIGILKQRYLPSAHVSLVTDSEIGGMSLPAFTSQTREMVVEYDTKVLLLGRISQDLYLKINANTTQYNIGILKSVSKKISENIRAGILTLSS